VQKKFSQNIDFWGPCARKTRRFLPVFEGRWRPPQSF